jgi:hypothetical protein
MEQWSEIRRKVLVEGVSKRAICRVNAHPIRQRAIIENDSTLVVRQSA